MLHLLNYVTGRFACINDLYLHGNWFNYFSHICKCSNLPKFVFQSEGKWSLRALIIKILLIQLDFISMSLFSLASASGA